MQELRYCSGVGNHITVRWRAVRSPRYIASYRYSVWYEPQAN